MLEIRKSEEGDKNSVWEILKEINENGESFVFEADYPKNKMLEYWFDIEKHCYTALIDNKIVGSFILKDNQIGRGAHIANASYAVASWSSGQGIGKKMGEFIILEAKKLGYTAMQFNIVVKTNERAFKLWQAIGFKIIGEIPEAFNHAKFGLVNAYIMYQKL